MSAAHLKSRFPKIISEIDPSVEGALRRGVEAIVQNAKDRVPVGHDAPHIRDHIHVDRRGTRTFAVTAGDDDFFYGHMIEHGTVNQAPQPFLVPAVEASRSAVLDDVRDALRRL